MLRTAHPTPPHLKYKINKQKKWGTCVEQLNYTIWHEYKYNAGYVRACARRCVYVRLGVVLLVQMGC